jgi:oxygen-dependent protoporphyrinogen oxidase
MSNGAGSAVPTVAIVGAGLAGIAAAVRLRGLGAEVMVFDPEPPGGKARTLEPVPGWRIEGGPHSFTSRADALFALADELGVAGDIVRLGPAARDRYLVRDGRLRRMGLMSGALRLGEWWSILRGLFRTLPEVPDESVGAWAERRFGPAVARGPLDAVVTGIWAADPVTIAMDAAFPRVVAALRTSGTLFRALRALPKATRPAGTYTFTGGMGTLGAAAVARLGKESFVAARVEAIRRDGVGWRVDAVPGSRRFDAVVIATEAPAAAWLLAEIAPASAAALGTIPYAPLAVAHWTTPDAALPHGFGWLAAFAEERPVLGCIFVSDLFPGRCPPGYRAFTTMFGGARRPADAAIDEHEARRRLGAEHAALTGKPVTIDSLVLVRHHAAVPTPTPGHGARVAGIRAGLPAGLGVAGAWCGAGAMHDAAAAGQDAAATVWGACRGGGVRAA